MNSKKANKRTKKTDDPISAATLEIRQSKRTRRTKSVEDGADAKENNTKPAGRKPKKTKDIENGVKDEAKKVTKRKKSIEIAEVNKELKNNGRSKNKPPDKEVEQNLKKETRKRKQTEKNIDEDVEPEPKKGYKKVNNDDSKQKKTKKTTKNIEDKKTSTSKETKNRTSTSWSNIVFSTEKRNPGGKEFNLKITSWNVDGLRACIKKGGLDILKHDKPDILALQETKCTADELPEQIKDIEGYHQYWCSSAKKGYAGVGLLSKKLPIEVTYGINNKEHDEDGRCLTAEYEHFFLCCVYVPNAGRGLVTLPKRLDWNRHFKYFVKSLENRKPVIICGDMNVAHNEIDLTNPKTNKKNAGFTAEERQGMTDFLESGYVDTFRSLYPDKTEAYTYWSYMMNARQKNIGWRLDYFLVTKSFESRVCDSVIFNDVYGSDHCPITLFINV